MAQVVAVKATVDVSGSMQVKHAPGAIATHRNTSELITLAWQGTKLTAVKLGAYLSELKLCLRCEKRLR